MVNTNFPVKYQTQVNENSSLCQFIRKLLKELLKNLLGKALMNLACNLRHLFQQAHITDFVNKVT